MANTWRSSSDSCHRSALASRSLESRQLALRQAELQCPGSVHLSGESLSRRSIRRKTSIALLVHHADLGQLALHQPPAVDVDAHFARSSGPGCAGTRRRWPRSRHRRQGSRRPRGRYSTGRTRGCGLVGAARSARMGQRRTSAPAGPGLPAAGPPYRASDGVSSGRRASSSPPRSVEDEGLLLDQFLTTLGRIELQPLQDRRLPFLVAEALGGSPHLAVEPVAKGHRLRVKISGALYGLNRRLGCHQLETIAFPIPIIPNWIDRLYQRRRILPNQGLRTCVLGTGIGVQAVATRTSY